jgi:ATP-dependent protease ClpP protease subunit
MLFDKLTHNIYLFNEINFENVKNTIQEINKANLDDKTDKILITICSSGGLLNPTFALCEHIRLSKKPVYCLATGYCASGGVAILQCGVERLATANTRFMVHSSNHKIEKASYEEILEFQPQAQFLHDHFINLTVTRSGMTLEEFASNCLPMKYLSTDEAKVFGKYGLIDTVI